MIRDLAFGVYARLAKCASGSVFERSETLRHVHRCLMRRLRPGRVHVDGFELSLDATDSLRLSFSDAALSPVRFLLQQVRPGETVIDVGAHIGLFTVALARRVGRTGRVVAFEPDPTNFRLLQQNIAANDCRQAEAVHAAVADHGGTAELFQSPDCSALHRLQPSALCGDAIRVPTVSLDEFWTGDRGLVHVIKLDVEGSEMKALRGMSRLLETQRDVRLFVEFEPRWLAEAGTSPRTLLGYLVDQGLHISEFDGKDAKPLADPYDLLRRYDSEHREGTNLWCVRPGAYRSWERSAGGHSDIGHLRAM